MLQEMVVGLATGGSVDDNSYHQLRRSIMEEDELRPLLPQFIRTCRTGTALWGHLKQVSSGQGSYAIRSQYVYDGFQPILDHLDAGTKSPTDAVTVETLEHLNSDEVQRIWSVALQRRKENPDGAITSARTLLESVCKHILDDEQIEYGNNDDLPKLYRNTAKTLNLAPDQHTEEVFKSILGSCQNVIQCLGTLRNKIGDAHGKGRKAVKPKPRHAALAVNLAGTMATFLVDTWESKKNR
nr:abortive infection family protein [Roseibium sp. CAU 1639]